MLAAQGALGPNRTYFSNPSGGTPLLFSKPNVYEADLHSAHMGAALSAGSCPALAAWFAASLDWVPRLREALPDQELVGGDTGRTIKAQWNAGGGSFPCHYDNPGPPSARALSVIVYLNPGWAPGDGGELVLMPFLAPEVVVPPLHNRAAFFLSDRMLHRVYPPRGERFCLTTWVDGEGTNLPEHTQLRLPPSAMEDLPATAAGLRRSPAQRSVARAVYAEAFEASLAACMGSAEGGQQMLAAHRAALQAVAASPPLQRLVAALRQLRDEGGGGGGGSGGGGAAAAAGKGMMHDRVAVVAD